jgi:hypothetical protein
MMRLVRFAAILIGWLAAACGLAAVEEKYPSGTLLRKYELDEQGRRTGPYLEYHESGKLKVKANCKAGQWDGPYASFHPGGKPHVTATYQDGKLTGAYTERTRTGQLRLTATYREGRLLGALKLYANGRLTTTHEFKEDDPPIPRTLAEIQTTLAAIEAAAKTPKSSPLDAERHAALRRLMAYRALAGVPHANLELDEEMNAASQAGAKLCAAIGRLDHNPKNPGWSEEEYQFGLKGTSRSNLHRGIGGLVRSVDGFMYDSDLGNIDRLGHRRWCLNPGLRKAGFGRSGKYFAMYCADNSQTDIPDYDYITYPASGFMPVQFFAAKAAWSVSLNPKKYRPPADGVTVKVLPQPGRAANGNGPIRLNYRKVNRQGFGIPNCIIFRPERVALVDGMGYRVEIDGLEKADGTPASLRFVVVFVNLLVS